EICGRKFPDWIYSFFRLEAPEKLSLDAAVATNKNLFHLVCQMVERQQRFGSILRKAVFRESNPHPWFAGCYIAGTGRGAQQQAFVAGVFNRLVEMKKGAQDIVLQETVRWTDEALREDESRWRWARGGYVLLATAIVGVVALFGCRFWSGR